MNVLAVIPVRMGSSRFPGKPLKKINGKSMVSIIYENVLKSNKINNLVVATCDTEIFRHVKSFGGHVIMTSKKHTRATERTAEALKKSEKKFKKKFSIIVMVQGDEPMVNHDMISKSITPFKNKNVQVVNLISKIKKIKDFKDPNCIKVVKDKKNNALYFSRSSIPFSKQKKNFFAFKQVCVIPFRKQFLLEYIKMKETNLEKYESVDMMRILENGYNIKLVEIKKETYPVDTINDLRKVSKLLKI